MPLHHVAIATVDIAALEHGWCTSICVNDPGPAIMVYEAERAG